MGLPSGLQWASCNVGAAKPSDLGLYFSWGNIEGHGLDEEYDFSQDVYDSTPAASIAADLSLDQDAARAYLGEPWRMPASIEFQELCDNCTIVEDTLNGVFGCLFTSNINGNKIFLPLAGYFSGTSLNFRGSQGFYWSSTYGSAAGARTLAMRGSTVTPQNSTPRYFGLPIRAVIQF